MMPPPVLTGWNGPAAPSTGMTAAGQTTTGALTDASSGTPLNLGTGTTLAESRYRRRGDAVNARS